MEYLKVSLSRSVPEKVSVLVNGEKNGFVGDILTLEEGFVSISAEVNDAEGVEIELMDTTPTKPKEIIIQC